MMDEVGEQNGKTAITWTATQTYVMATVCLLIGVLVGYLARGSAKPASPLAPNSAEVEQPASASPLGLGQHGMPSLDDMKRMADKKAEPLLAKLKTDPRNAQLLNQIGILYKSAHQFQDAQDYFHRSLDVDPQNVNVRADFASCLYYNGDVDGALAQLQKGLSYDPKHAGALMNIGIIRWQGKNDVDGAVASWEKLLKLNPNFSQKDKVEQLIAQAKQQRDVAKFSKPPKG
jgi:cytochrome c-type biogenesis protein CcmH/NrfG